MTNRENPHQKPPWLFDPWNLGEDVRLDGLKLLVVAESHYLDGYPLSAFKRDETQNVVRDHGLGVATSTARTPLYRTLTRLLETESAPGGEVWRHVYFYNYFQRVMEVPTEKPTPDDYAKGVAPFDALLRTINPDAVLVVSSRLWKGMKNETVRSDECKVGRIYEFTGAAELRIPAARINHPSAPRPFVMFEWRAGVDDFLACVRRRRIAGYTAPGALPTPAA